MSNLVHQPIQLTFEAVERLAVNVAKSGLFGVRTPEQAMALMMLAQSEGLHPMAAARDYHVIDGRPAMKAEVQLARFQAAGGRVTWDVYTDTACVATFSHPQGGTVTVRWDMETAKRAGLGAKQMWSKYPRRMLWARVISEGVRTCWPAAVLGVYTPEEIADFDNAPPVPTATLLPSSPIDAGAPGDDDGIADVTEEAIMAAGSVESLRRIGEQLAKRQFSKQVQDRLRAAYKQQMTALTTVVVQNESQPTVVTEVEE